MSISQNYTEYRKSNDQVINHDVGHTFASTLVRVRLVVDPVKICQSPGLVQMQCSVTVFHTACVHVTGPKTFSEALGPRPL